MRLFEAIGWGFIVLFVVGAIMMVLGIGQR